MVESFKFTLIYQSSIELKAIVTPLRGSETMSFLEEIYQDMQQAIPMVHYGDYGGKLEKYSHLSSLLLVLAE